MNTFFVFRNGKLVTVLTTTMDNYNDAVDCDRVVMNPKNAKKQVEEWLKPQT